MKKRITAKDWTFIGKYNYAAKWCRPFCTYYLQQETVNAFERIQKLSWPAYILIFLPVHLLQAFVLLWDGGLKEFIILKRYLGCDTLSRGSEAFKRAEEVWMRYLETEKDIDN